MKELIDINPERILFELYKVIKKGRSAGRQLRASLIKFSEICKYIKPSRCRKYITSLLVPLSDIISEGDELLQESLANCMDNLSKILVFYLKDKEVNQLLDLFMKNLNNSSAPIRRSASISISILCLNSPFDHFQYTLLNLLNPFKEDHHKFKDLKEIDNHQLLGVLYCIIQLVKVSYENYRFPTSVPRHPLLLDSKLLSQFCIASITQNEDHNVVGSALELLNQLLSTYGKIQQLWDEDTMKTIASVLTPLCIEEEFRTSSKAVALSCLSNIILYYPLRDIIKVDNLIDILKSHNDPLIRGNIATLIGSCIAGNLKFANHLVNPWHLQDINSQSLMIKYLNLCLSFLADTSGVAVKMACKILGKSLKYLTNTSKCFSLYEQNCYWATHIIKSLLSIVKEDTYWLVKIEVLSSIANADYRVINLLEQKYIKSIASDSYIGIASIQQQIIQFIRRHLGDSDLRVRNHAANTLVNMIPRLWFTLSIEQPTGYNSTSDIRESISKITYHRAIQFNLSHILKLLVEDISSSSSMNQTKGCYSTLLVLAKKYSHPLPDSPLTLASNVIGVYMGDIVPLVLDRLVNCQWLSLDLDIHTQIIQMLGYFCYNSRRHYSKHYYNILKHLMQLLNIMSCVVSQKSLAAIMKEKETNVNSQAVGTFYNDSVLVKLFERLSITHSNAQISVTSERDDKFALFLRKCLQTLSIVLERLNKDAIIYVEEIIGYLVVHYDKAPKKVTNCVKELFICVFSPVPLNTTNLINDLNNYNPTNPSSSSSSSTSTSSDSKPVLYDQLFGLHNPHFTTNSVKAVTIKGKNRS